MPAPSRSPSLASVHADVWHANALAHAPGRVLATGHAALDAQLPGGGWPLGALTEILQPPGVHGEWRLLMPALARCGTETVVLVGAPQVPFVPALAAQGLPPNRLLWVAASAAPQRLWAAEQALRCAGVDAVLAWLVQVRPDQLRRLQMAAAEYAKLLFVLRPQQAQDASSPAVLRLLLGAGSPASAGPDAAAPDALAVHVLKRRGPPLAQPLQLAARPARLARVLAASTRAGPDRVDGATVPLAAEYSHALARTAAHA
jgi:protein ImuA